MLAAGPSRRLTWIVTAIAVASVGVGGLVAPHATALDEPPEPTIETLPDAWPAAPEVDAEAYVLVEAATGQVLAGRAPDERRPVASTIKVLTALTVLQRADILDEVTAGEEVEDVPGASVGLEAGDTWTVEELLTAILARSGNEAAQALAVHVGGSIEGFLELMRSDLASIGLTDVPLSDVSGLDDGNLLSARELATIARVALEQEDLRRIVAVPIVTLPGIGAIESRNQLLSSYPDATGLKTGFTNAAGNSLVASARRGERELIAVVLGSGDDPARFDAAAALLDHGFDRYRTTQLSSTLRFAVAGGWVEFVVDPAAVSVPDTSTAELRVPLQARAPVDTPEVPIEVDGRQVATLTARRDAQDVASSVSGTAALGRGAVDGAYAALRAGAATGSLR